MEDAERLIVERRITQRVLKYWEALCGGRIMPQESDIDPDALEGDWAHCFLLQTRDIHHIEQFNFTYLGAGITSTYHNAGIDLDNMVLIGPNAFYLAAHFLKVVDTRAPLIDEGHFYASNGSKVLYRQVLLPIGERKTVEAIFGAMLFKTMPKGS